VAGLGTGGEGPGRLAWLSRPWAANGLVGRAALPAAGQGRHEPQPEVAVVARAGAEPVDGSVETLWVTWAHKI